MWQRLYIRNTEHIGGVTVRIFKFKMEPLDRRVVWVPLDGFDR